MTATTLTPETFRARIETAIAAELPQEPAILTANTYFWQSSGSASSRRRNEERHSNTVAAYLTACGFTVTNDGAGRVDAIKTMGSITTEVCFTYSESCNNVYKHLVVTRNSKRSNILGLRKAIAGK